MNDRVFVKLLTLLFFSLLFSCSNPVENSQVLDAPELTVENVTYDSFTVKWLAVENATSYQLDFCDKVYSVNGLSKTFEGVEAGKYEVKARAISEKDYEPSAWTIVSVEISEKEWEPVEEDWYGEWTLYSDKTLVFNSDTDVRLLDEGKSVDIVIEKHPDYEHQVIISGMSVQNPAVKLETIIDNGKLAFFNMVPAEMPDDTGAFPIWLSFTQLKNTNQFIGFMMGNFNAYTFSFTDRNNAEAVSYNGVTQDDREFEVVCFEVFRTTTDLDGITYYSEFPVKCPAGNLRLKRR